MRNTTCAVASSPGHSHVFNVFVSACNIENVGSREWPGDEATCAARAIIDYIFPSYNIDYRGIYNL
jgi:hypothetical protein